MTVQTEADLLKQAADLLADYRSLLLSDYTPSSWRPELQDTIAALRVLAATKEPK